MSQRKPLFLMALCAAVLFCFLTFPFYAEAAPVVGAPVASPATLPVGQPTLITVTSLITSDPANPVISTGVNLLRVDAAGNVIAIIGVMHDDGLSGDAVAGDGIFTLQFTANEPAPGEVRLRVSAAFKGLLKRVLSTVTIVPVVACTLPEAGVLQTGQTKCWANTGSFIENEIACAGTGQDGEFQKGAARDYTDNGDGTITDNVTGLMWEKLDNQDFIADSSNTHDTDNTYNPWTMAFQKIADLNAANFAGYSDWRLPNVKELQSVVSYRSFAPATVPVFNNVGTNSRTRPTGTYWSSTTFPSVPFNVHGMSFTAGASLQIPKTSAANNFCCFVRAVRGPITDGTCTAKVLKTGQTQCWDSAGTEIACPGTGQDGEFQIGVARSYTDNGDGTIADNKTGLLWEKLGNRDYTPNFSDPHDADNNTYTWTQAFQKIADLNVANFAGYNDWRLPNITELESLAFFNRETSRLPGPEIPAVDQAFDNGTDSFTRSNGYWSSTTGLVLSGQAYGVNFVLGNVYFLFKTQPFANGSVRAVRGP